ncbi:hypothetical protein [Lactiplantibacillus plantarum]|uniref:hypothetical protein n=1 Tax=Lactiplantibacillus TaxID=2767842 RepID=UPI0007898AE0|nr:hypothetical protein [Lactiplantibacillus plantarum]APB87139.1 hypothetical protein BL295_15185 [Lactiplantibacillus plantarum]AUH38774.1 hypothetical protein CXZ13_16295 [Lactiplantibacillus plantarum]KYK52423.1 hypothetical protein AYO51_01725 [Lactiplantibacillus plantarum]KYM68973.1 hypothetical protein AZJ01_00440 [Lactiplantibacillus plantarum]MDG2545170.1 hypothetical protein [Lactiplantibacillus plantarum]
MTTDKTIVAGSELPVLMTKGDLKYLDEVGGQGQYRQVAWIKSSTGTFVPLYGIDDDLVRLDGKTEFPDQEAL